VEFPGLPFRTPLSTLTAMPSAPTDHPVAVTADTAVANPRVTASGGAALAQA